MKENEKVLITDKKVCNLLMNLKRFQDEAKENGDVATQAICECIGFGVALNQMLLNDIPEKEVGQILIDQLEGGKCGIVFTVEKKNYAA